MCANFSPASSMWWFDVERERIRLQVNFHNPALVMKLWCEIGLSMNFLVLCSFIYKMRLLQPCGKINNDLRNRIQLCVRAKTRVRESQLLEAGKRWEGAPDPAPIWGGGATSRMGGQFSLGSQPRTWDCRLLLSRILGFCSLVCVWHWGATVLDSGTGKMCSLMWLMHDPGASHETALFQLYSVSTPSADFTCFMCSFIQQILLSCSWVSVAGLHSGAVTTKHHCLCTAYKESWGECSPSDLLTSLSASMSMGMVFCLSLHPALWCLVSFCFVYFPFCVIHQIFSTIL